MASSTRPRTVATSAEAARSIAGQKRSLDPRVLPVAIVAHVARTDAGRGFDRMLYEVGPLEREIERAPPERNCVARAEVHAAREQPRGVDLIGLDRRDVAIGRGARDEAPCNRLDEQLEVRGPRRTHRCI